MIHFKCTTCGAEMESPDSRAEQVEICPECKAANWVPLFGAEGLSGTPRHRSLWEKLNIPNPSQLSTSQKLLLLRVAIAILVIANMAGIFIMLRSASVRRDEDEKYLLTYINSVLVSHRMHAEFGVFPNSYEVKSFRSLSRDGEVYKLSANMLSSDGSIAGRVNGTAHITHKDGPTMAKINLSFGYHHGSDGDLLRYSSEPTASH